MSTETPDPNVPKGADYVLNERINKTDDATTSSNIQEQRIERGYILITLSILLFLSIAINSVYFFESLEPRSSAPYVFDYVSLSARAVLTAAIAVFSYKMLRTGERMIIPLTLVKSSEDLHLVLGVEKTLPKAAVGIEALTKALNTLPKRFEGGDQK